MVCLKKRVVSYALGCCNKVRLVLLSLNKLTCTMISATTEQWRRYNFCSGGAKENIDGFCKHSPCSSVEHDFSMKLQVFFFNDTYSTAIGFSDFSFIKIIPQIRSIWNTVGINVYES